jgi:hypothetical protein
VEAAMLAEAAIAVPGNLTFVPLDLEHHTLAEDWARRALMRAGPRSSAGWGWFPT